MPKFIANATATQAALDTATWLEGNGDALSDTIDPDTGNLPTPTPTTTLSFTREPSLAPTIGSAWTRPADGMVMVYIPADTFQMGSEDGDSDEVPVHTVTLDSFWIDSTEVTNAQYQRCVDDGGACVAASYHDNEDFNGDNQPAVGVNWNQANAYCTWVNGQLPTEAQWEYAARGPDGFVYPWGNDFDCTLGNFDDETEYSDYVVPGGEGCDGYIRTAPVGSFPDGASWISAYDMAGNVWEWVADWYGDYPESSQDNPTGPETGDSKVLRGGSWINYEILVRSSNRYGVRPANTLSNVGFRCVAAHQGQ